MQLINTILLPTKSATDTFYRETISLEHSVYEMDYLLGKFIEEVDEARQCSGLNPASREVEERFIQSVYYAGIADYVEGESDMVFNAALSKLFRSLMIVLVEFDKQFSSEEGLVFLRLVGGNMLVGTFSLNPLTPEEFRRHRQKVIPGAIPWTDSL